MANILRGYGAAREGSYFKQEQEAELQQYRRRLVKEGKLTEEKAAELDAADRRRRHGGLSMEESEHEFEVLAEIMAARARVDDPEAAR